MYQAQPVSAAEGKYWASFSGLLPKPPVATTTPGGQRVLADAGTHDGAVRVSRRPTRRPSAISIGAAAVPGEHVDHRLAATDRAVHPRHALVTAEHQLVVVLHPEVAEPFDGRPRQLGQPPDDGRVDLPLVELHVVVK